jgi:hypothetical protein
MLEEPLREAAQDGPQIVAFEAPSQCSLDQIGQGTNVAVRRALVKPARPSKVGALYATCQTHTPFASLSDQS